MPNKDKRSRACPNEECSKFKSKVKFKGEEQYCSVCGSRLVLVCAKCSGPLEDKGPSHKVCRGCEAKAADLKTKAVDVAKKAGGTAVTAAGAAIAIVARKK